MTLSIVTVETDERSVCSGGVAEGADSWLNSALNQKQIANPLLLTVLRMGDSDDPQVFIETFHATVLACQLPEAEWVPWLLPTLSTFTMSATRCHL